ncbi:MAG: chromate efflux transporter [Sphaerochaeta sp.]|jgi:chromate transporter|uniref:chromate efflux transporter n=1 Tax=Sphaerochaeta sp. TaxID=1972642 RepID=UPI002A36952B|nr:chromate efflux transporter [Sphaerochaeta sp.]MDX9824411.1 chromate efflux transporter [Sphaerochaeta sp.]
MHNVSYRQFLKDVLICSLGAYGGPEAHFGVFLDHLVSKKQYLSEEELVELLALTSILPGPTSTQTITAVGYRMGGPLLALLTLFVWAFPPILGMTALSFLYQFLKDHQISEDILRFIAAMAVGFIFLAAFRIGKKVLVDRLTITLFLFGSLATYFIRSPWIFPAVLLIGGAISIIASKEKNLFNKITIRAPYGYLILFVFFALGSLLLSLATHNLLVTLFEAFYRYGYLVFGGGQVVVPVMITELVETKGYLTNEQFLTGYGLVQGLPGPMFSFSAYAGGMAARSEGPVIQVLAALISGVGIFLPGTLLIFFIYPVWEELKRIKAVKVSLKGINAVAGGLITTAAILLLQKIGITAEHIVVVGLTIVVLATKKIPAPLIVLAVLVAGIVF